MKLFKFIIFAGSAVMLSIFATSCGGSKAQVNVNANANNRNTASNLNANLLFNTNAARNANANRNANGGNSDNLNRNVLARAKAILEPPEKVVLKFENGTLWASGR